MSRSQLFVGRLPMDVREKDIEQLFEKYGRLIRCDVKYGPPGRRGPGRSGLAYAFVDFDDYRDAEDAIKYENGREMRGTSIVVEWARGPSHRSREPSYSRGYRSSEECFRCHRPGHWARDCPEQDRDRYGGGSRRRRSRSRSDSRRRRRSLSDSRSRSPSRRRGRGSSSRRRSRSGSVDRRRASRSRSRSPAKSAARSRSRSPDVKRKSPDRARKLRHSTSKSRSRSPSPARDSKSPHNDKNGNSKERSVSHSPRKSRSASHDNMQDYANVSDSGSRSRSRSP